MVLTFRKEATGNYEVILTSGVTKSDFLQKKFNLKAWWRIDWLMYFWGSDQEHWRPMMRKKASQKAGPCTQRKKRTELKEWQREWREDIFQTYKRVMTEFSVWFIIQIVHVITWLFKENSTSPRIARKCLMLLLWLLNKILSYKA